MHSEIYLCESDVMIDYFKLITVTHKQLNTQDLKSFIVTSDDDEELSRKLNEIKLRFNQDEILYLSTCNRVLFLFYGKQKFDDKDARKLMLDINPDLSEIQQHNFDNIVLRFTGLEAVRHLFEVGCSIDSLVVGEREILRQFRDAYNNCRRLGLCGDNIRIVEKCAVAAAKEVYTKTDIGTKPVSVVSLAIQEFVKKSIDTDSRIFLIGAGETNASAGRLLLKYGYRNITIFNRSLDNAKTLSKELGAEAYHLSDLDRFEGDFDCMIASTNAQECIVTPELINNLTNDLSGKLFVDLSIPANIALSSEQLKQAQYVNIDGIRHLADQNLKARSGHISAAKVIIAHHLDEFTKKYEWRKVERALNTLPEAIESVKNRALNNVYKNQIEELPPSTQDLIRDITSYMQKKCVAVPMKMAKEGITHSN